MLAGEPLCEVVEGETKYSYPCPHGIEVFNSKEGPPGQPELAEFPVNSKTKMPYLDVSCLDSNPSRPGAQCVHWPAPTTVGR